MGVRARRETKLIRVYSDLVAKLNEVSNREGAPFMEYVNSALEQVIRAYKLGRPL